MITAFMLINTGQGKLKLVSNSLRDCREVVEVSEVYGRYDIMIKVQVADYADLNTFSQNRLQIIEGIKRCETLLVRADGGEEE